MKQEPGLSRADMAERLFRKPCTFALSAPNLASLPDDGRPEVCFGGRSNAGKSSLLNALVGRRALARTSSSPGRTRALNFFDLGGILWLVDLPGYGYARASDREAKAWGRLVENYFRQRRSLLRAYVLIDARRGIGQADHAFMSLLDAAGVSHRAVATKSDKIRPSEKGPPDAAILEALRLHPAALPTPIRTSAAKRRGLEELRADIAEVAGPGLPAGSGGPDPESSA